MLSRALSRTSSKPKRNAQSPVSLFVVASESIAEPSSHFPTELLNIVAFMILPENHADTRASFRAIASFARVSKTFRQIAFRNFLRSLHLLDSACWNGIYKMVSMHQTRNPDSNAFTLLRTLATDTKSVIDKCTRLRFLRLQELTMFFYKEGLSTQHSTCLRLFSNLTASSSTLSTLTIDLVPRIDRSLLSLISKTFPCLKILSVSVTGRLTSAAQECECWCCFEDVLECSVHSPVPETYSDVSLLAEAFGTALTPLSQLTELRLGIFLSDEYIIYDHIAHQNEDEYIANSPSSCEICENTFGLDVRAREVFASRTISSKLSSLRRICWSTFFCRSEDGAMAGNAEQRQESSGTHFQSGRVEFELDGPEGTWQTRRWRTLP
ncbi:hypothetical protein BT96DRAFT_994162 [Gymnopus androsaceus JB14]|uniref:Uncharacterized protein n=1 Tax=Gymnopus androsaceus JB14 TaxID=1447944 RepID=A0A6A4HK21_9AGAR|nr:hypothetical protein BT96DRAFT_994162 [Gymnopus androsaceus JB14]